MNTYTKTTLLLLLVSFSLKGQYGADGAVAGAGHLVLWDMERNDLDKILDTQDYLISLNVGLALEEAKLLDISKQRYAALAEKDNSIENAETLAQIIIHGNRLFTIQERILELTHSHSDVQLMIMPALMDLAEDQGFLIADVVQATTDGATNLMDSSERLLHLKRIVAEIDRINTLAQEIYMQAKSLITLLELPEAGEAPNMTYDFDDTYNQMLLDIENLIINPE